VVRRTLTWGLLLVLVLAAMLPLAGCQRKVTMTTGEIVICTAGEVIEDNTREIEVPQSQVSKYAVTTKVITCDLHGELGALYKDAQDKIAKGDTDGAKEILTQIVQRDPSYRKAQEQLDQIAKGTKPTADVDGGTTTPGNGETTEGDDEPTGPVVSLTTYVPDLIDGYAAQGILADVASLSRTYLPTGKDANQLVIEVEQQLNAKAATAAVKTIADPYPGGRAEQTVNGKNVTVGSNAQYAIAIFADGSMTVAVELHATSGAGADLIDDVLAVVNSITK
jgi:hypothetical protein